ncbi:MAG: hypothetical protein H6Q72_4442 [Firmicutes bacterium]|nr:hypothetical protein [Bacillota bacterium]
MKFICAETNCDSSKTFIFGIIRTLERSRSFQSSANPSQCYTSIYNKDIPNKKLGRLVIASGDVCGQDAEKCGTGGHDA